MTFSTDTLPTCPNSATDIEAQKWETMKMGLECLGNRFSVQIFQYIISGSEFIMDLLLVGLPWITMVLSESRGVNNNLVDPKIIIIKDNGAKDLLRKPPEDGL